MRLEGSRRLLLPRYRGVRKVWFSIKRLDVRVWMIPRGVDAFVIFRARMRRGRVVRILVVPMMDRRGQIGKVLF